MEYQADGRWRKPFDLESKRTDKLLASHSARVLIKPASILLTNYVSHFQDDLSTGLCSIEREARALLLVQAEVITTYCTVTVTWKDCGHQYKLKQKIPLYYLRSGPKAPVHMCKKGAALLEVGKSHL